MMFELSNDYLSKFGFNGQQLSPKTFNPKKTLKPDDLLTIFFLWAKTKNW